MTNRDLTMRRPKMTVSRALTYTLLYTILVVVALLVLYPLLFTVSSAFSKGDALAGLRVYPFQQELSLRQFDRLFQKTNYVKWYLNTLKIAAINSLISVTVTTVAAYVFSRFRFRAKKPLLMSMLILQMFPSFAGMIALYILVWRMGLLDNHLGLILVYAAGNIPYNTWLIKGYLDTIPKSLDEAGRVDGAGYFISFFKIILPIARPMVTFLAITSFTGPWMDFILPRLLLKSDGNKTLAVGLFEMINGRENNNFTMFAAGAVLVAVPFMIIFALNQQYMTQVLAAGAVKE